jgi:putative transposase
VAAERAHHAVARLCRVVGASVSGFHAWRRAVPSAQARSGVEAELRVRGHIGRIFAARRHAYGAARVHAELRREGRRHSRRRVARLMREMGLAARRGRRRTPRTTDSRHDDPVAPNLLGRRFAAERPDAVWLADISYLPTEEGWLYLAAIEAGPRRGPGPRARSSAGAWRTTRGPGCASTPRSWPCTAAGRRAG